MTRKWAEAAWSAEGFHSTSDTEHLTLLMRQYGLISQCPKLKFIFNFLNCPTSSSGICSFQLRSTQPPRVSILDLANVPSPVRCPKQHSTMHVNSDEAARPPFAQSAFWWFTSNFLFVFFYRSLAPGVFTHLLVVHPARENLPHLSV